MHPKFATDDMLTAAAREYLEQHPELDPARVSIEFYGNPATGYHAAGHITLTHPPGYPLPPKEHILSGWCVRCDAPWDPVRVGSRCPIHAEVFRLAPWTDAHRAYIAERNCPHDHD